MIPEGFKTVCIKNIFIATGIIKIAPIALYFSVTINPPANSSTIVLM